jgi:peptidoglycan/xylan/chitin deacetylase (PgdA/CDA1 family)
MPHSRSVKSAVLSVLTAPGVNRLFAPLRRGRASVFMLHRFREPALGVAGHDPGLLRQALAYLRRHRYEMLALPELFRRLAGEGSPLRAAVAFTIDDGYFDHATVAAPVFADYDCPVTTFVTTGFLDRKLWMWWDRVEYVFHHCRRPELQVQLDEQTLSYRWQTSAERDLVQTDFIERCKLVADAEKHAAIERLTATAEVEIPPQPPPKYEPMSWDQVRACEAMGMTFGPHTVTHPVLTRTSDDQSRREMLESWDRLRAMASRPVPIFCYPNGQETDYGAREIAALRAAGFLGAVVGAYSYADAASFSVGDGPFRVRRFGFPDDLAHVVQCVSGMERAKELLQWNQRARPWAVSSSRS